MVYVEKQLVANQLFAVLKKTDFIIIVRIFYTESVLLLYVMSFFVDLAWG